MKEYERGKEIGELVGEIKTLNLLMTEQVKEQREMNEKFDQRLKILETWVATTTGKVVILTTIFGIIGSIVYIAVSWLITHFKV